MNTLSVHQRIKILIEETNDAFTSCGSVNTDYAEFAAMALSEFKNALSDQRLTPRQLTNMLRTGMTQHKQHSDPESCWATFMAHYIAQTANQGR